MSEEKAVTMTMREYNNLNGSIDRLKSDLHILESKGGFEVKVVRVPIVSMSYGIYRDHLRFGDIGKVVCSEQYEGIVTAESLETIRELERAVRLCETQIRQLTDDLTSEVKKNTSKKWWQS